MNTIEEVKTKIANQNIRKGIGLSLSYIAPRKKKSVCKTFSGDSSDIAMGKAKAIVQARRWLKENGGKFVKGYFSHINLWDSDMGDGQIIVMVGIDYTGISTELTDSEIAFLN